MLSKIFQFFGWQLVNFLLNTVADEKTLEKSSSDGFLITVGAFLTKCLKEGVFGVENSTNPQFTRIYYYRLGEMVFGWLKTKFFLEDLLELT